MVKFCVSVPLWEKSHMIKIRLTLLISLWALISSCGGQTTAPTAVATAPNAPPIDEYVVEIFEDRNGILWFGTIMSGVARFDGKTLTYLSEKDGLPGNTVVSIAEDKDGNLWFGTHSGLSRYNGITFTNFKEKDGLCNDRVSNLLIDKNGTLWVGTWKGVCRYDGKEFSTFDIPKPDVEPHFNTATREWVTEIMQDGRGNLWFGRDGYGACRYNGHDFQHFTTKDGLPSNNVQVIEEDNQGNLWFGSRVAENDHPDPDKRTGAGGLCRYDGKNFTVYPTWQGLHHNDVYSIFADESGDVWIGATKVGVYRYDGNHFTLHRGTDRMDLTYSFGVQDIKKDRSGRLWFGFSGGLFRLMDSSIVHVSQQGPWH